MRAFDWASTPLGPVDTWPQSLRSAVSILLPSRAQIVLFWGDDLVTLYNDAYSPVFGVKHPWALGRPARECWREVWDVLEPLFRGVVQTGEAFHAENHPFFLERHGFVEETYFDVSYDPVRNETGDVGGVFCIVTETTGRVLGERRLRTLSALGSRGTPASEDDLGRHVTSVLEESGGDVPFALVYLFDDAADHGRLIAFPGVAREGIALPDTLSIRALPALHDAVHASTVAEIPVDQILTRPPATAAHVALVLPLRAGTQTAGILIAGVSRHLALKPDYRDFLGLVATSLSSSIAGLRTVAEERRRAEALAEIDRAKTAFFNNVSHEFRTPLTLLLAPLDDLRSEGFSTVSAADRERLEVAHRNAVRLLRLVNTLLDFSRIEADRAEAVYVPGDLGTYTAELASAFHSLIDRAGLRYTIDCAPVEAFVDHAMWEKIVFNLVSNAFKHTFEGEIRVALRRRGDRAELVVADTGVGIPVSEQPHIFQRFHRVRGARARTHEGTGIGLALVAELVRLHGGVITVTSEVGRGSVFTVSVPLGSTHLPPERIGATRTVDASAAASAYVEEAERWVAPTSAQQPLPDDTIVVRSSEARVLVADDNADMREYIVRLLAPHWTVEAVGDGAAAFDSARARPPDLVVTDVMMPGLDGFELLRALRADPLTTTVPVILLSARAGEESRVEGLEAGADDYLTKPFSARELVARVASQMELARVRRVAADRERVARAEAESANRAKDEFLAMLSHELRTPLTAVVGWTRILRRTPLDDAMARQALDALDRNTRTQVQLIDDLLDVSRIIAGKLDLERQPLHVPSVIKSSIESLAEAAERKGVAIQQALDATGGAVLGDEMRLAQIVTNLVGNAVKFTREGGHVLVSLEDIGPELVLTVQDDGIGIAAEDLPRVFDRFHQGTLSRRGGGGLGLGLAIVQHLVKLHGGRITVHSDGAGQGARFSVYLPRLAGQDAVLRDRAAAGETDVTGLDILIVEDNPDSREMIVQLLRSYGATVQEVDGAEAALEVLARHVPDAIVSDIGLAGLDGFGLIRRIRALPGPARNVPAIALTAYARAEDRAAALAAGYQRYLTKPIEPSDLRAALAGVVDAKRRGRPSA